jgi:hypothetical protein
VLHLCNGCASATFLCSSTPARRVILEVCNFRLIKGGFLILHLCIFCTYSTWIIGMAWLAWCREKAPRFLRGQFPFWLVCLEINGDHFHQSPNADYCNCGKRVNIEIHYSPPSRFHTFNHVCMMISACASLVHGIRNR